MYVKMKYVIQYDWYCYKRKNLGTDRVYFPSSRSHISYQDLLLVLSCWNYVMSTKRYCDIIWDVFILYLDQGEGSFQRFPLSLLHSDSCYPTSQGPKVEVASTAKYVDSNYTLRDWGNDYWMGPWTRDHCGLDLIQDSIYHLAPINPPSSSQRRAWWPLGLWVISVNSDPMSNNPRNVWLLPFLPCIVCPSVLLQGQGSLLAILPSPCGESCSLALHSNLQWSLWL